MNQRVYLDTSAFSQLWGKSRTERELARARHRLTSPHFSRQPVLVAGLPLLRELAALPRSRPDALAHFHTQVEFLFRSRFEIPMEPEKCIGAELREDRAYMTPEQITRLTNLLRNRSETRELEAEWNRARNRSWLSSEQASRKKLLRRIGDQNELGKVSRSWRKQLHDATYRRAKEDLIRNTRRYGATTAMVQLAEPLRLPTLWSLYAYFHTRIWIISRDGRALDPNDCVDQDHYVAAANADLLVIRDTKFLEIAQHCPGPVPQAVAFDTWIEELLRPND